MDGMPGETRLGNTQLIHHGIQNEQVDLRFHVSITTKSVYIFEPRHAIAAMQTGLYINVPVFTGNVKTATGYLIPPESIKNCRRVPIPDDLMYRAGFSKNDSTSMKGAKAEAIVNQMIRLGLISLVLDTVIITDEEMQINGSDIVADLAQSFQVKCDWKAGPKELGGSGNLFIQDTECNPLRQH